MTNTPFPMETIGLAKDGRHVLLRPRDSEGWEDIPTIDGAVIGSWFDQDIDQFVGWGIVTDMGVFTECIGSVKDEEIEAWGNLPPLDGSPP
jgi:hypothetical protein